MNYKSVIFASALFVGSGLAVGGYFIGNTLYKSKISLNTATVKGLAERQVSADQAVWTIGFSVACALKDEVPDLYRKAENDRTRIIDCLKAGGILPDEIATGPINYSKTEYRNDDKELVDEKHELYGNVTIYTSRVEAIKPARARMDSLIIEGINVQNQAPNYLFTRLNEIKPSMLEEATRNARTAAAEFAKNAGVKVGKIRSATQGGFSVVDAGEDYGDKQSIRKEVRVVTTVEFYLTD
ncbi:MAG: SIMPL domain-containing protein [Luteolibacter sp.]